MNTRNRRRQRKLKLESLETRKVFAANALATPIDVVQNEPAAEIDTTNLGSAEQNSAVAAQQQSEESPFKVTKRGKVLQIRALVRDTEIVVSKLKGKRLNITSADIDSGRHLDSQIVSLRGVREIEYLGTGGRDAFHNLTSTRTVARGRAGDDLLRGGSGRDLLIGGDGDDTLYGGRGKDDLRGMADKDRLFGGPGRDELHGGDDDDELYGEAGRDTLRGGAGDDYLHGGGGRDYLYGNRDSDRIHGGKGRDYFFYELGRANLLT